MRKVNVILKKAIERYFEKNRKSETSLWEAMKATISSVCTYSELSEITVKTGRLKK